MCKETSEKQMDNRYNFNNIKKRKKEALQVLVHKNPPNRKIKG